MLLKLLGAQLKLLNSVTEKRRIFSSMLFRALMSANRIKFGWVLKSSGNLLSNRYSRKTTEVSRLLYWLRGKKDCTNFNHDNNRVSESRSLELDRWFWDWEVTINIDQHPSDNVQIFYRVWQEQDPNVTTHGVTLSNLSLIRYINILFIFCKLLGLSCTTEGRLQGQMLAPGWPRSQCHQEKERVIR